MKNKLTARLLCFALILCALVAALDKALFDQSTVAPCWRDIRRAEKVDVLFTGNSHTCASTSVSMLA